MPYLSYLDPTIDLEFALRFLKDIEILVDERTDEVKKEFNKWQKENQDKKDEEFYQWREDYYVDEFFFVTEVKRNLLNGLAVTLNTILERHIGFFIREIRKKEKLKKSKEKPQSRIDKFHKILKVTKHPNQAEISLDLWNRLEVYTKIRDCIIHAEGVVDDNNLVVRLFVKNNKDLFVLNQSIWEISVTDKYITEMIEDIKKLFQLLAYNKDGTIIYY